MSKRSEKDKPKGGRKLFGDLIDASMVEGAGVLSGGLIGNSLHAKMRGEAFNSVPAHDRYLEKFKKKYAADIPEGLQVNKSPDAGYWFKPLENEVLLSGPSEEYALHELGHAKNLAEGGKVSTLTKWLMQHNQDAVNAGKEGKATAGSVAKQYASKRGFDLVQPFEEAFAWKKALDIAKTSELKKSILKKSVLPYSSYGLKALGTYAGLGLTGKALYDYFRGDNNGDA